ncbi:MAG: glycosyltransferase [Verrucomicrobiota bacterium JB022]|nr:glycosyltransferase [Verrucomicrobiota bacterium JB022]
MNTPHPLHIVVLGLSITSSWGNGHATTYRALLKALQRRGHRITFLERDVPWYASNRDLPHPDFAETHLYTDLDDLKQRFADTVRRADMVIVGSYVPDGVAVGHWACDTAHGMIAFYDIDTPVTLEKLARGDEEYLSTGLIPRFDLYLSFTGGPLLRRLEQEFGAQRARPLYCSVDPELYYPEQGETHYDLGYLGTYSDDRQPGVDRLMLEAARHWRNGRFAVAGPQYPDSIAWPENVRRIEHLPPAEHRAFYNQQRATLNITRAAMRQTGYAPSVRLFEAAACGTPVISDYWNGLDTLFDIGSEILISRGPADTLRYLQEFSPADLQNIGTAARKRILASHTADHRAAELEGHYHGCLAPALAS